MSKRWRALSVVGSANRKTNEKKHYTESVSVEVQVECLSRKLGQEANKAKVYIDTHTKKDGSIVDDFSRGVVEEYNRRRNSKRCARRLFDRLSTAEGDLAKGHTTATEGRGEAIKGIVGER